MSKLFERVKLIFRAAPGVLLDGQETQMRCDATGALVTTGGGGGGGAVTFDPPLTFDTGGTLAASGVARVTAGTMLDINVYNGSASPVFVQLFDAAAVPADGAVPVTTVLNIPAGGNGSLSFADGQGRSFTTGIAWAASSTDTTKTITAAALQVNIQHRDP